jgi:hypothetical protein
MDKKFIYLIIAACLTIILEYNNYTNIGVILMIFISTCVIRDVLVNDLSWEKEEVPKAESTITE